MSSSFPSRFYRPRLPRSPSYSTSSPASFDSDYPLFRGRNDNERDDGSNGNTDESASEPAIAGGSTRGARRNPPPPPLPRSVYDIFPSASAEDISNLSRLERNVHGGDNGRQMPYRVRLQSDTANDAFEVVIDTKTEFGKIQPDILDYYLENGPQVRQQPEATAIPSEPQQLRPAAPLGKQYMIYNLELGTMKARDFREFNSPKVRDTILHKHCWMDIQGYDFSDMKMLCEIFGIHPLIVEDVLNDESREKCEYYENFTFVTLQSIDMTPRSFRYFQTSNTYILFSETRVFTFQRKEAMQVGKVLKRLFKISNEIQLNASWIFYAILDDIIDSFIPFVNSIQSECDYIDELTVVLGLKDHGDTFRRIWEARKAVTRLDRLLSADRDIFKLLTTSHMLRFPIAKNTQAYLQDVFSHVLTMAHQMNSYQEILTRAHSNYLAQISLQISELNTQISQVMKTITGIGAIFVPMTLISGIFGMNVRVPGQIGYPESSFAWFFGIVGFMVLVGATALLMGRRHGWL